jgi:hypothetical protein
MSKEPHSHHTCFDRVVPKHLDPHAAAHQAAVSDYVAAVKAATKDTVKPDAPFGHHIAAVAKSGELHANHVITKVRMAIIDKQKVGTRTQLDLPLPRR